jgi:hypothetical protein
VKGVRERRGRRGEEKGVREKECGRSEGGVREKCGRSEGEGVREKE